MKWSFKFGIQWIFIPMAFELWLSTPLELWWKIEYWGMKWMWFVWNVGRVHRLICRIKRRWWGSGIIFCAFGSWEIDGLWTVLLILNWRGPRLNDDKKCFWERAWELHCCFDCLYYYSFWVWWIVWSASFVEKRCIWMGWIVTLDNWNAS